ncbi:hypothetical protein L0156_20015 [bacterium]|nr:hypothetical protein [bacterium]
MKEKTLFFVLMVFAGFAFAQTQTIPATPPAPPAATSPVSDQKPLAEALSWLGGQWEGEGVMSGDQEFLGTMKATRELDDQAIVIMRESMNKAGGPSGGRKEIMIVGYEGSTKKIILTLHTSSNFTGIYTGEYKTNEIVFSLAIPAPQAGYVNRRSFKLLPDGALQFIIESGSPGKAVGKVVEINFKKKA